MRVLLEENPTRRVPMWNPRGWFGESRRHRTAALKGRRRRGGFNPIAFDEFGNPIEVGGFTYYKPSIRRRVKVPRYGKRLPGVRNPLVGVTALRQWTQGVDLMDVAAGVGGLAAATMIPGTVVKDTSTGGRKLLRVLVSIASALGMGFLARSAISPSAGKAAIIGGLAGTGVQVLGMTTGIKIGEPRMLGPSRRIGVQETISPSLTREGETVQLIQP